MAKKILLVDDSALMRRVISDIINSDIRFKVEDTANNGLEALDLILKNRFGYDAVILDINMPKMDGLAFLEQLQKNRISDLKIIMNSSIAKEGARETILALERGAFDFITKPERLVQLQNDDFKNRLLSILEVATGLNIKSMSVQSGRMEPRSVTAAVLQEVPYLRPQRKVRENKIKKQKLAAIACSTGGPKSLRAVIPLLPRNLDAPVLLVQHMPKGFTATLAARLDELSMVKVKEAQDKETLVKGCVYIAPGGKHLKIKKGEAGQYEIAITDEPAVVGLKPCANLMYESLAGTEFDEITCVVLTGMGTDGTEGIRKLDKTNRTYVIAQDKESSVVYGMPNAIAKAGLTDEILPLDRIAAAIEKNVGVSTNGR